MRPVTRSYVEHVIHELIDLLDAMDGDADFEEPDFEPEPFDSWFSDILQDRVPSRQLRRAAR
jgi:hypothetical protein